MHCIKCQITLQNVQIIKLQKTALDEYLKEIYSYKLSLLITFL